MKAVLKHRLEHIADIVSTINSLHNCTIFVYDMFDGKAVYCSTGHSHWSRLDKPFLLCECEKGDHSEENAVCEMLSDLTYISKIASSRARWGERISISELRASSGLGEYDYSAHKDWCSKYNSGVCHVNSMTDCYKISSFRPDVFHGRGAVTKLMLRYIRKIMEGNSRNLTIFATYLRNMKYWDGYVVDPWEANEGLQHCKGRHTKEFVRNTDKTVSILKRLIPGN